jgi:hypothetical protein
LYLLIETWFRRRPWSAATAVFIAVVSLVYFPLFSGKALFFRDISRWIYPARFFVRKALAEGQWPLWNPDIGIGFSVGSDSLYGLFYPGNWLYLVGPPFVMVSWVGFLHLLFGGVGMLLLARRFALSPLPALVVALGWTLSGSTTSWWTVGISLNAIAWLPWTSLGLVRLAQAPSPRARDISIAALPFAMSLLLGEVFFWMLSVGLAVCLAFFVAARGTRLKLCLHMSIALLLGLLGGAAAYVPAVVGAKETARGSALAKDDAEVGSFHPMRFFELGAPGIWGDPFDDYPGQLVVGDARLSNRPLTDSAYAGASILALVLLAFGRQRRLAAALGILTAAMFLFSVGKHLPLHGILRTLLPPLGFMRYPEKYMIVAAPCLALLAGLGAQRVFFEGSTRASRILVLLLPLVAVAIGTHLLVPPPVVHYFRSGVLRGACVLGLMMFLVRLARGTHGRVALAVTLALVCVDLATADWPLQRFASPRIMEEPPALATLIRRDAQALGNAATPRLFRSKQVEPLFARGLGLREADEVEAQSTATLAENTSNVFGVAAIGGYDAAIPSLYSQTFDRGRKDGFRGLRLLSCQYALLPHTPDWDQRAAKAGLQVLAEPLGLSRLYRIPDVLPRVYFAPHAVAIDNTAAMERITSDEVVDGKTVLLAAGTPISNANPGTAPATCSITSFTLTQIEATCNSDGAGHAVFVEQFHPGWQATVDGRAVPVLRANLVMRAVALSPGEHQIVLEFTSTTMSWALPVSLAVFALMMALLYSPRSSGPMEPPT